MPTFIERYHGQTSDLRPAEERALREKIDGLKAAHAAARTAMAERHLDEMQALDAAFNEQFNTLHGRPTGRTSK
jgi:DNA-binding GntR family transcriptional regulator